MWNNEIFQEDKLVHLYQNIFYHPLGCFNDMSANWSVTVVGQASPNPSRLNMDNNMRFILAPKSHKALSKMEFLMVQVIVKLSGSFSFCGSFL